MSEKEAREDTLEPQREEQHDDEPDVEGHIKKSSTPGGSTGAKEFGAKEFGAKEFG